MRNYLLPIDAGTSGGRWMRQRSSILGAVFVLLVLVCGGGRPLHAQQRQVVQRIPPVYPEVARQLKIQGVVRVAATVDSTGKVVGVGSFSRERLLVPAALNAVRKWRFEPGLPGTVLIDVQFRLEPSR